MYDIYFLASSKNFPCDLGLVPSMELHEQLASFIIRSELDIDVADTAMLRDILDKITPLRVRVERAIADNHAGLLVYGDFCERYHLPENETTVVTNVLVRAGYERKMISGVRCWIHPACKFPKLELHRIQQRRRGNEHQSQSVPGHARV